MQEAIENIDQCLNANDTKDMLINLLEKEKEQIMKAFCDANMSKIDCEEYYYDLYNQSIKKITITENNNQPNL